MQNSSSILIVDDEPIVREVLIEALSQEGYQTVEAADGESALECAKVVHPSVVLTDVRMPRMGGVELLIRLKELDPEITVAVMTGYGNEDVVIEALRNGAVNFFHKPLRPKDAVDFVRSALRAKRVPRVSDLKTEGVVSDTKRFAVKTLDVRLLPIVEQVTLNLDAFLSSSQVVKVKIAVEEMIQNGIEHGNLEIGTERKHEALSEGRFGELLQESLSIRQNARKRVFVSSALNPDGLTVTIEDEGKGFDWPKFMSREPTDLLRLNGRGILLAQMGFDTIVYNERGNLVTLEKRFERESE